MQLYNSDLNQHDAHTLVITASFTSEPIERAILFWLSQLGSTWALDFAPYNQIFQQLLDPASAINLNRNGANVVLVRFEDWIHQQEGQSAVNAPSDGDSLHDTVVHFTKSLTTAAEGSALPYIVCICPPSPQAVSTYSTLLDKLTAYIAEEFSNNGNIHLISWHEVLTKYPLENYYNSQGDKLGRVPYTEDFFTALAATIARKLFVINQKPYKVIVLDCDNTVWGGVVGEDGPHGITVSETRHRFHKMLIEQYNAGLLLCLCSKNIEADVLNAFQERSDMPLQLEHIVSHRINWQPKSQNIHELADELQLGLDSFIFIDDNPVECAEVQANCPEVLTIQFPTDETEIESVTNNIWAFDRLSVTAEDKKRTQMYRQNVEREKARSKAPTLKEFLDSLDLKISCAPMRRDQLPRVSQLTHRTNQFNASTVRRSEAEIDTLCSEQGYHCLALEVSDKFGDYGLVGVAIYVIQAETLVIDTFLLSCRVLGRSVEHKIIEHLAQVAPEHGATHLSIKYLQASRNEPVFNFLEQIGSDFRNEIEGGAIYTLPVQQASQCSSSLFQSETEAEDEGKTEAVSATEVAALTKAKPSGTTPTDSKGDTASDVASTKQSPISLLSHIALELNSVAKIKKALESQIRQRPDIDEPYVSPQTLLEKSIADIWAKTLFIDKVGLNDKFTEIGGGSLQIVQVHGQIEHLIKTELSIMQLFTLPTVKSIAQYIDIQKNADVKHQEIRNRASRQLAALRQHQIPRVRV